MARMRIVVPAVCAAMVALGGASRAAEAPSPGMAPPPQPYQTFVQGATVQHGLIPIIEKAGTYYFSLTPAQLREEYVESSVPSTGLGGFGPAAGEPYVAPARVFRFERVGRTVVLRWPNTYFKGGGDPPRERGVRQSFPSSVIAVVPIVAEDPHDGTIVIPATPFLGDVADYEAIFQQEIKNPMHGYHLDPSRTFFTQAKALPENDVLRVTQTWASMEPDLIDNVPDARSIEVGITYNIFLKPHDGYMPRLSDPRVGYFEVPFLNFASDERSTRNLYYITRWNFAPQTPEKPSKATHPLVFYISNDVPVRYRRTIRDALLTWNDAFAKVGILDAIQVREQPDDPAWDPDDIRHNMVRWVDTTTPQYGAEALIITDPTTGEEVNVGINIDAVMGLIGRVYTYVVAPARGLPDDPKAKERFVQDYLRSVVLHESGHDMGLQHNFIGSMAYTARDLQNRAFTQKYGVATSVMEYAPINLWPKGTPQGDYVQLVLGPYDYHAIRYGYEAIPGAHTPEQERPTLANIASQWANPLYRFASDEDTEFFNGHAVDPRVQMFDLTNHPLAWCGVQDGMMRGLLDAVDKRFPKRGEPYDQAREAFQLPLNYYIRCAMMAAHVIGGEYLSRNRAGDPHAEPPLRPVSRAEEMRAWHMLAIHLFDDAAWRFNPAVLDELTYSEHSILIGGGRWAYDPPGHHDIDVARIAATAQDTVLDELFAPLTLQRIDALPERFGRGATMKLSDLFDWSYATIFGDIRDGHVARIGEVKRDLHLRFAERLARLWVNPGPGIPADARSLARSALVRLANDTAAAERRHGLDNLTRAHLEALGAVARQALEAHVVIPEMTPPPGAPMESPGAAGPWGAIAPPR
jgi:hypothetical protein